MNPDERSTGGTILDEERLSQQQLKLLENRQVQQWKDVRTMLLLWRQFSNGNAGREVLRILEESESRLAIEREDGYMLLASFDPGSHTLAIWKSAPPFIKGFKLTYRLSVRAIKGSDAVVWIDDETKRVEEPKRVAIVAHAFFMDFPPPPAS
jgi:hypothetical protein